jgi:hypothetical protein
MEALMIVLQFLVVVCGFIWGSAYSLTFHPRALVPRFIIIFFIWGSTYSCTFHPRALVPRFTSAKVLALLVQKGKY